MAKMKIVLKQAVTNLGDAGDQVSVSGGYARNFLIPRGFAVPATKGNVKQADTWRNSKAAGEAREKLQAEQLRDKLRSAPVTVTAQAGPDGRLFGSVTAADVAQAIGSQLGVEVDRHQIELEPIKHLGVHEVKISLHPEVSTDIPVEVLSASAG
jgi:large subunit ribosomal protein L9